MASRNHVVVVAVVLLSSVVGAASAQESGAPMTKEQADAILNELRQIRRLLERPPHQAAPGPAPAASPVEHVRIGTAGAYSLGSSDATLTLVEFTDYQCPFCKQFHDTTFQQLKTTYIDTGRLRFVHRDLPLDFHNHALKAAQAARCAGEQDKFWPMRDILIAHSTNLGQELIFTYAQRLTLDMNRFRLCLDSDRYLADIQHDIAEAGSAGISGTPTFVLGWASRDAVEGVRIVGAQSYAAFERIIREYSLKRP